MSVQLKEVVLITPLEPTPNQVLYLSSLDSQLFVRFTYEYLLVYKPHTQLDRAQITENVKMGLGRALVPYYPLAGRVRKRADGLGLEVMCRAQGIEFVKAASDSTVAMFEEAPSSVAQWRKFLSLHTADVLKEAPPVVVQLTWLSDGGATLAFGFNHCLCDGVGSSEFLNAFAQLAIGKVGLDELSPKPIWNRHLLDSTGFESSHQVMNIHQEFIRVPDLSGFDSRHVQECLIPTSTTFDSNKLNMLKELTKSNCTSFDVLSAHVWQSWAKAMRFPSNQILKLIFTVNIRQRVTPSLPSGYYGNAFVLGCAQTSAKELTKKGLGYATELIRRAKERVGDEYVKEVVKIVSSSQANVDSVGVMIMTQWSKLGLESVDFGMGRPVQIGPVCYGMYCILSPVYDQMHAIKVNVAVPKDGVDLYLDFLRNPLAC